MFKRKFCRNGRTLRNAPGAAVCKQPHVLSAAFVMLLISSVSVAAQQPVSDSVPSALDMVAGAQIRQCPDSFDEPSGPRAVPVGAGRCAATDTTQPRKRAKAVELSDAYATRLTIHRWASYSVIPLFAAQAVVGQQLFVTEQAGNRPSNVMRDTHDALAVAVGALFAINTVTGSWNWWETRTQTQGRTWRTIHAALMLVSDAGFAYTAALGSSAAHREADRTLHKNLAIGSASVALVSYAMMLWPIRRDW